MTVSGNYISDSDVTNWAVGTTDAQKTVAIQRAEQIIEKITKDYFYVKSDVMYFDGNGKNRLFLGLNSDILTITEIRWYNELISSDSYTYDKKSVFVNPSNIIGYLEYDRHGTLFPKGIKNIKITLTHGWTTCPAAIKRATVVLVTAENDPTTYAGYSMNESESVDGYSFKRSKFMTGILEADKLINQYIRRKPIFGAA